ncbi:hypothetical protein LA6_003415 [Marinibacterium anthonyi]|nr:hypothetical protein LA6_003415 [Marinibacterium anthonyi]
MLNAFARVVPEEFLGSTSLKLTRSMPKKETRPVGRVSMWCYFELVNGSTANSEQAIHNIVRSHFQFAEANFCLETAQEDS